MLVSKEHTPNGEARRFFEEAMLLETDDCIIWPYGTNIRAGYGVLDLGDHQYKVHRLALLRATGAEDDPAIPAIHGPCHNRLCFNPRHLSWGTHAQNADDRRRDGTHFSGENHPTAKLTRRDVEEIRRRYAEGGVLQRELGAEYGCNQQQISHIVNYKAWAP